MADQVVNQAPPGTPDSSQASTSPANSSGKPSATPPTSTPVNASWKGTKDQRVRLLLPQGYLDMASKLSAPAGKVLKLNGGIVFPYTPSISFEHVANYNAINTVHSNYTQYFYKNSAVNDITIAAKFTVRGENEAVILILINHMLRALTKMKFGDDQNAGSPPPVCRLMGWGQYQLDGIPVVLRNYKMDLPDNVDYFTIGNVIKDFGVTSVPVATTLNLTLSPVYSRNEQLNSTVEGFITGGPLGGQRTQGYL